MSVLPKLPAPSMGPRSFFPATIVARFGTGAAEIAAGLLSRFAAQRRGKRPLPSSWPWAGTTESLSRPRQRAVDHGNRILHAIDRDERAEARAFFLAEQHLVEHVEPVERNARAAVL